MTTDYLQPGFTADLVVEQLMMFEVRGTPEQVRPQFLAHLAHENLNVLTNQSIDSEPSAGVTAVDLAKLQPPLMSYAPAMIAPRDIPGGWDASRVAFIAILSATTSAGMKTELVVGGYTDKLPATENNVHDFTDVTFYVNSINQHRSIAMRTEEGELTVKEVVSANHVLTDPSAVLSDRTLREYRVRPVDVFATITVLPSLTANENIVDTRTALFQAPVLSKRENEIPSVYLSNILSTFRESSTTGYMEDQDLWGTYAHARMLLRETTVHQNPFLQWVGLNGIFKFPDLERFFPGEEFKPVYLAREDQSPEVSKHDLVPLVPGSYEDQTAIHIGHAVNGLMAALGISRIVFAASNISDGKPEIMVSRYESMLTVNSSDPDGLEMFRQRMIKEVFEQTTQNNEIRMQVIVEAQLYGETQVQLAVTDHKWYSRTIASYADALLSPLTSPINPSTTSGNQSHVVLVSALETMFNAMRSQPNLL